MAHSSEKAKPSKCRSGRSWRAGGASAAGETMASETTQVDSGRESGSALGYSGNEIGPGFRPPYPHAGEPPRRNPPPGRLRPRPLRAPLQRLADAPGHMLVVPDAIESSVRNVIGKGHRSLADGFVAIKRLPDRWRRSASWSAGFGLALGFVGSSWTMVSHKSKVTLDLAAHEWPPGGHEERAADPSRRRRKATGEVDTAVSPAAPHSHRNVR